MDYDSTCLNHYNSTESVIGVARLNYVVGKAQSRFFDCFITVYLIFSVSVAGHIKCVHQGLPLAMSLESMGRSYEKYGVSSIKVYYKFV